MENPNLVMSGQSWRLLLSVSLIWAASFLFVEFALTEVPFITIMTARVSIGAVGLYVMLRLFGIKVARPDGMSRIGVWGAFLLLGLVNNVIPFSLIVWSQTHLSASLASILNATMPLFVVFLAHFFTTDEKITWPRFIGIFIGFLGVTLIVSQDGINFNSGSTLAKFTMLGAACSYGVAALIGRHYAKRGLAPMVMAWGQSTGAALIAIPIALIMDRPWELVISLPVWATLVGLGLLCSSVAYALYFRLIATAGATNTSLVTLLIPPFAIVLGSLLLSETLEVHHMIGMAAIGLGLLIVDGRLFKKA
jgi:drug/metabolite transporter (DMT)-like permease